MTSALLPRIGGYSRKTVAFVLRHKWSVPLSVASSLALVNLADEMREGELDGVDAGVATLVHGWRGSMDGLMLLLTKTGGGRGMTTVAVVTVLLLLVLKRRRAALFMASAALGTLLLTVGLKLIFHRARPLDVAYLIDTPSSFSFPSGHTLGSMGVMASLAVVLSAVGLPRLLWRLAALLIALYVLGVALSRVYFGVHFPSDVAGGALAAAAWVSAWTGWFYPRLFPGERALEPAPPA